MVDSLSNIRYQNSIYYNNYNIVNQVFKATFSLPRAGESVCIRAFCVCESVCMSERVSECELA